MPKPKLIETPEKLMELFQSYRDWCKANPRYENMPDYKNASSFKVERERPLTWDGFENWLRENDVIAKLDNYKANVDEAYTEYRDIIRDIDRIIWADKFEGATVGIYNHNIIARDLGLADKKEHSGEVAVKQITGMEIK